ncbi:DMT family transporter [Pseudorhodoferax sp.]|uniref:DMT family transporter n=1 Tax=Pseudorhodoferax sp. TaxID=1993553 RepID=UPI0039E2A7BC
MSEQRLTPATAALLTIPPLLWASNAIVGRLVVGLIPPVMLNFLRWTLVFALLLPLAWRVFRPGSGLWRQRRHLALLGLLSVGSYNALLYLALQTSTPINVTLVGSSMPVWMLAIGLLFGARVMPQQLLGAALSVAGVLVVLSRGDAHQLLQLRLVTGDLLMVLATVVWSLYSWLLTRPGVPEPLRADWASLLMAQVVFGTLWAGLFAGGEALLLDPAPIAWSWPLAAALLYVAVGPSLLAYQCWGAGVRRAGPSTAAFFANLMPLFAVLMSGLVLHESPQPYHALAFGLTVGGILVSSRRRGA